MKSRFKFSKARKFNERHKRKLLIRSLQFKDYKKKKNRYLFGLDEEKRKEANEWKTERWRFSEIEAPTDFSMTRNPSETVAFLGRIAENYDKRKPSIIELGHVESVEHGAICILLSLMVKFRNSNIDFNGTFPKCKKCAKILRESGFFEHLKYKAKIKKADAIKVSEKNSFATHANKTTDPRLASEAVMYATQCLTGRPKVSKGTYSALIELMQNTVAHASPIEDGRQHWWLSVHFDKESEKVHFTFLDYGVGVFKSLNTKARGSIFFGAVQALKNLWSSEDNADVLRLILNGEMHRTVTGKEYRGKGLPGIRSRMQANYFDDLVVVTNDVFADVKRDIYTTLDVEFSGTFVCWSVTAENEMTEWINLN